MAAMEQANPFLAHLLKEYLPDDPVARKAAISLAENVSATEEALRKKMQDSMKAAASVLKAIEEMKNCGTERPLPGPEETKLTALINILKAENGRLMTEMMQDALALKKLESDVADKEFQILTMHRKLAMSREDDTHGQQPSEGPNDSLKKEMPRPSSTQNIASSDVDTSRLQATIDARTREVEQRDKVIATLERYVVFLYQCEALLPNANIDSRSAICFVFQKNSAEVWRANPLR